MGSEYISHEDKRHNTRAMHLNNIAIFIHDISLAYFISEVFLL